MIIRSFTNNPRLGCLKAPSNLCWKSVSKFESAAAKFASSASKPSASDWSAGASPSSAASSSASSSFVSSLTSDLRQADENWFFDAIFLLIHELSFVQGVVSSWKVSKCWKFCCEKTKRKSSWTSSQKHDLHATQCKHCCWGVPS